jgi:hypothetical protein
MEIPVSPGIGGDYPIRLVASEALKVHAKFTIAKDVIAPSQCLDRNG